MIFLSPSRQILGQYLNYAPQWHPNPSPFISHPTIPWYVVSILKVSLNNILKDFLHDFLQLNYRPLSHSALGVYSPVLIGFPLFGSYFMLASAGISSLSSWSKPSLFKWPITFLYSYKIQSEHKFRRHFNLLTESSLEIIKCDSKTLTKFLHVNLRPLSHCVVSFPIPCNKVNCLCSFNLSCCFLSSIFNSVAALRCWFSILHTWSSLVAVVRKAWSHIVSQQQGIHIVVQ
jgi:hypothetical protein